MVDLNYAHEKLAVTMDSLAVHPAALKVRLLSAVESSFVRLGEDLLPEDLRGLYRSIYRDIAQRPAAAGLTSGGFAACINSLTEEEALDVARRIARLAAEVASRQAERV